MRPDVTLEVEREKTKQEAEKTKQLKRTGKSSSGTPSRGISGIGTPKQSSASSGQKSVGYYFDDLKKHFDGINDRNRYSLTITKFKCDIYDGKESVYNVTVDQFDSTSIRNLSLMMYASDYKVGVFLEKFQSKCFGDEFDLGAVTPPLFLPRSNVYAFIPN